MPSLFSRARTTSSPLKAQRQSTDILDEFGRVPSRANGTVPAKKDKNVEKTRTRTLSAAKGRAPGPLLNDEDSLIPDGSFFPFNLDPPGGGDPAGHSESERGPYYLFIASFLSAFTSGLSLATRCDIACFPSGDRQCSTPWSRVAGVPIEPRALGLSGQGAPC
jgi:hypothetical protein